MAAVDNQVSIFKQVSIYIKEALSTPRRLGFFYVTVFTEYSAENFLQRCKRTLRATYTTCNVRPKIFYKLVVTCFCVVFEFYAESRYRMRTFEAVLHGMGLSLSMNMTEFYAESRYRMRTFAREAVLHKLVVTWFAWFLNFMQKLKPYRTFESSRRFCTNGS